VLLRKLLGPITLVPKKVDIGRPYCVAKTSLDALVLLEKPPSEDSSDSGSNSYVWWRRTQRIRTASGVSLEIVLLEMEELPLYQQIARTVAHLRDLGLSLASIARRLEVDDKTVAKAVRWLHCHSE
jgi:hypothetical protein